MQRPAKGTRASCDRRWKFSRWRRGMSVSHPVSQQHRRRRVCIWRGRWRETRAPTINSHRNRPYQLNIGSVTGSSRVLVDIPPGVYNLSTLRKELFFKVNFSHTFGCIVCRQLLFRCNRDGSSLWPTAFTYHDGLIDGPPMLIEFTEIAGAYGVLAGRKSLPVGCVT